MFIKVLKQKNKKKISILFIYSLYFININNYKIIYNIIEINGNLCRNKKTKKRANKPIEEKNSIKNIEENPSKSQSAQSNIGSEIKPNNSSNSKVDQNPGSNNEEQIDKITINNGVIITPEIDLNANVDSNHNINYGIFESVPINASEKPQKKSENISAKTSKNGNFISN